MNLHTARLARAIASALVFGIPAFSQTAIETAFSVMADDNINNSADAVADRIASLSLDAGSTWEWNRSSLHASYRGGLDYFAAVVDRSTLSHGVNIGFTTPLNDDGSTQFDAAAFGFLRSGRGDYRILDHQILSLALSLSHEDEGVWSITGGYRIRGLSFPELSSYDYSEHVLSAQTSFFFPTRTTVIVDSDVGLKVDAASANDSMASGRMAGSRTSPLASLGAVQWRASMRIGQALLENTGISVSALYQENLKSGSHTLASINGLVSGDELFDDRYGYEGFGWSVMMTQVLPFDARLRAVWSQETKDYASLPAYDLTGTMIAAHRNDRRSVASLSWEQDASFLPVSFTVVYEHIVNASNDPYFSYTNNAFTVVLAVPF